MARVVLRNVTKRFGDHVAVSGLNLDVEDGEFLVLVGPSGCGKSTTLRLIAGLEELTEGEVYIGDRLVNGVPPRDRDVAMVFQSYALYPHLTVYDNLAFGLHMRRRQLGLSKGDIDRRVREVARTLGIEPLLGRRPKQLSGGERQRVALGRAIVRHPKVFLFDEPLSNLDAQLRVEVRRELKQLHRRLQATMIFVTHDQIEAMTLGDRVVVLRDGVIQQVDTPQRLYQEPANLFVARFIGSPPMNLLTGRLRSEGDVVRFETDGFSLSLPPAAVPSSEIGRIVLGIRPEDLSLAVERANNYNVGKAGRMQGRVEVVEPMGAQQLLYVAVGANALAVLSRSEENIQPGQSVPLVVRVDRLHWFDPDTERRLVVGTATLER